jgi:hypothetical protein
MVHLQVFQYNHIRCWWWSWWIINNYCFYTRLVDQAGGAGGSNSYIPGSPVGHVGLGNTPPVSPPQGNP